MIGRASAFGMPTIVKLPKLAPKLVLGISDKLWKEDPTSNNVGHYLHISLHSKVGKKRMSFFSDNG